MFTVYSSITWTLPISLGLPVLILYLKYYTYLKKRIAAISTRMPRIRIQSGAISMFKKAWTDRSGSFKRKFYESYRSSACSYKDDCEKNKLAKLQLLRKSIYRLEWGYNAKLMYWQRWFASLRSIDWGVLRGVSSEEYFLLPMYVFRRCRMYLYYVDFPR